MITDILFNSRSKIIPNAKNFRDEVEIHLPSIFDFLNRFIKTTLGKVSAKSLETQLQKILDNWHKWRVYDEKFINGLKMTLKIPRDFKPQIFKTQNDQISLFDSTFDNLGKAKTVALDITKENYQRLLNESKQNIINAKSLCEATGIKLDDSETDESMILKLNTLEYVKMIEDFTESLDSGLKQKQAKAGSKKSLNLELLKAYELFSHITSTVSDYYVLKKLFRKGNLLQNLPQKMTKSRASLSARRTLKSTVS